jgi:hypothetical protein
VWTAVPTSKVKAVAAMLKAIHAQEDRAAARQKAEQVVAKLKEMKLTDAAALLSAGIEETLYYYAFPREHWRSLRTNNPLERILREHERLRKNLRLPFGGTEHHQTYASTNMRKNLDTTSCGIRHRNGTTGGNTNNARRNYDCAWTGSR